MWRWRLRTLLVVGVCWTSPAASGQPPVAPDARLEASRLASDQTLAPAALPLDTNQRAVPGPGSLELHSSPSDGLNPDALNPYAPSPYALDPQAQQRGPWTWPPSSYPVEPTAAHVPGQGVQVLPEVDFENYPLAAPPERGQRVKLKSHKDGFFQRASLTTGWLSRGDHASVGVTEIETSVTGALPLPSREQPMLLTPGFGFRFLDAPAGMVLPDTVYDTYLDWTWLPRFQPGWSGILSVTPGVYSDFETYDSDALRITGRALVKWEMRPDELEILLGVVYLDRDDVRMLPAAGMIWMPNEFSRVELIFPRPRIGYRLRQEPGRLEEWVYLAGEFGGGTWLVERGDTAERMTMSDWRVFLGAERKMSGGAGLRFESGYVFGRTFEFATSGDEYEVDGTLLVRLGGTY